MKRMHCFGLVICMMVWMIPFTTFAENNSTISSFNDAESITNNYSDEINDYLEEAILMTQSRTDNFSKNYTLTGNGANDMVSVALAQEGKTGSSLGYSEDWCADFISDCAILAGQSSAIPADGYVPTIVPRIENAGGVSVTSPSVGDIAVYDWDPLESGTSAYDHVGIVYKVSGSTAYTIDGNAGSTGSLSSNKVVKRTTGWALNEHKYGGTIVRFVRPNYQYNGKEMTSGYARTIPDGDYIIANAGRSDGTLCYLDLPGTTCPAANQTKATIYNTKYENILPCDAWTFSYSNGFYTITQKGTNMALEVAGADTKQEAKIQVYQSNGTSAQKWAISSNGRNGYRLQCKCSGFSIDIAGGGTANNTTVWQYSANNTDAQSWNFIPYLTTPTITHGTSTYHHTGNNVSFSWNAVANATSYQYYISRYPTGYAYSTYQKTGSVTGTGFNVTDLPSGWYCCFIHAISSNGSGAQSKQSNVLNFFVYDKDYVRVATTTCNGHIYALYDNATSWYFAKHLCEQMGGHLATITSQAEENAIETLIDSGSHDSYWLGANDLKNEETAYYTGFGDIGTYHWITGEAFSYTNWRANEPSHTVYNNETAQTEHFLEIRKSYEKKWNDCRTQNQFGFILEIEAPSIQPITTATYGTKQYEVYDANLTWEEANDFCKNKGGHLATITSVTDDQNITNLLQNASRSWYYVGAKTNNGNWQWTDNTPLNYTNWSSSFSTTSIASGTDAYLMKYKTDGQWIGIDNLYYPGFESNKIGFIFEKTIQPADLKEGWKQNSIGWWYQNADGTYPKDKWQKIDGKWYHFNEKGYRQTGWLKLNDIWYYLQSDGVMVTGWQKIGSYWYCFNTNGSMAHDTWKGDYYLLSSGRMATDTWIGDKYVDSSGKYDPTKVKEGWVQNSTGWWYRNSDGTYPKSAWKKIDGKWYHFDSKGYRQTGWLKLNNTWYYLKSDGVMATGWLKIGSYYYYFNSNGSMASDTWIGNYYVDASGRWIKDAVKE